MFCQYRIWRSIYSDFATFPETDLDDETCHAYEVYTDETLREIRDHGFNGIWVHAILAHIACAAPFPELSPHAEQHREKLRILIARAEKYGIKVFLYIQLLRAVPLREKRFWEKYGDSVGGSEYPDARALCISTETVRNYLERLAENLAEELPGLGGVLLITASELPAHCYSHRQRKNEQWGITCPRCAEREPSDVVLDQLLAFRNGVRRKSQTMEIIVWTWSWSMWGYQAPWREFLDRLPPDVTVMTDFERGGFQDYWMHPRHRIDEYCLSFAGPSEACSKTLEYAGKRGMKRMVKLQFGTTHELASVVSLPLLTNVARKIRACRELGIDGFMGCWNFGSFFSANTAAAMYFLNCDAQLDPDEALRMFVREYFGPGCDPSRVTAAYGMFEDAMHYFPFSNVFIYNAPVNYALAYSEVYSPGPAGSAPCGPSHLDVHPRGDSLAGAADWQKAGARREDVYSMQEILETLPRLCDAWEKAAAALQDALRECGTENARLEINNAVLIGKIWRSTLHAFRSYVLRTKWESSGKPLLDRIIREEMEVARSALPLLRNDRRQGWHGEAGAYLFSEEKIMKKLEKLEHFLRQPAQEDG